MIFPPLIDGHSRNRYLSNTALAQLQPVAVRVLEHRSQAPRPLENLGRLELHAARLQCFERVPAIFRLDGICGGDDAFYWLGATGCPRPQDELEVLTLHADSYPARSAG